jgi:hypothetical protein
MVSYLCHRDRMSRYHRRYPTRIQPMSAAAFGLPVRPPSRRPPRFQEDSVFDLGFTNSPADRLRSVLHAVGSRNRLDELVRALDHRDAPDAPVFRRARRSKLFDQSLEDLADGLARRLRVEPGCADDQREPIAAEIRFNRQEHDHGEASVIPFALFHKPLEAIDQLHFIHVSTALCFSGPSSAARVRSPFQLGCLLALPVLSK